MKAALDHFGLQRIIAAGHAMGGYVCERLAARYPEQVAALVLVDGGLTPEAPAGVKVSDFIERFLGPSLRRLDASYVSRSEYHSFWRAHPAFAGPPQEWNSAIESFVDYDLEGVEPVLRSRTVAASSRASTTTRSPSRSPGSPPSSTRSPAPPNGPVPGAAFAQLAEGPGQPHPA